MNERRADELLVRARDALWRTLEGAVVVLGPDASKPRVITGPAAEVWAEVAAPRPLEELVAVLAARHGADPQVVRADVLDVVVVLQRDGALEAPS